MPPGAALPYARGPAAPQHSEENGRTYRGGGIQLRVLRFDPAWIRETDTLADASAPLPPVKTTCPS